MVDCDIGIGPEALANDIQILPPGLGAEHLAPAVEEELRVIADPGTNLQHALVAEVEPQRGQVLLTAGVVPKVKDAVKMPFRSRAQHAGESHQARIAHLAEEKRSPMAIELLTRLRPQRIDLLEPTPAWPWTPPPPSSANARGKHSR
ncbi:Uncharacterised protein [Mycobacterium tuberculosis]|uniref:Uncharacterized protein n=1 Tax=Mycobacterium tuberculosis TaxID=1773 RepID=A0A916LCY5_MYCTX|nr:hypothetical protein MRGA423_18355 [Mycobacterium tuberculosis RGTB423]CKR21091.1 Uncharacterised protein [Mycobacterium tuberculosis]CKT28894.1 Uncharacterised protein [Mycobacterium tuberculosis]CNV65835.1 Uncharacterised protein [Mycobacterium tuberculosis]COY62702.1 Uncharacterised protein [Mycobacterium tuberculosis]